MNEIMRMRVLFQRDNYHCAFRKQLLLTLLRIHFNRIISKESKDIQRIMGFHVVQSNLKNLCHLFDEIFINGVYYSELDKKQPEIIDCGSNIGMSILFFKKLYPKCKIMAFEPCQETFKALSKTIELNNLHDVKAFNVAVSNEDGEITLYTDPKTPCSHLTSIMDARCDLGKTEKVRMSKLSHYINHEVDLLKLDVEGAEHFVLQDLNISKKLQFIKKIIIEYHHHLSNHVGKHGDNLSGFLSVLEENGFDYQVTSILSPPIAINIPQDIMIYAYKK